MTGLTNVLTNTLAASGARVSRSPPADLKAMARTADVPTIARHIQSHPGDRKAIEHEMVAAGRTGDLSRVSQTLKYELPHWQPYGKTFAGPSFVPRPPSDPVNSVATSPAWPGLVRAGKVTASEQRVIGRMAMNEGHLDSVQA